jgi:hypothetical protein
MVTAAPFGLQIVVTAPWGEGQGEIPTLLHDRRQFAEAAPGAPLKVRAPVQVRLDPRDGLHLLAGTGVQAGLFHFDASGVYTGRTGLLRTPVESADDIVVDFAVDAEGSCYLLEVVHPPAEPSVNRLRCLTGAGDTVWSRTGPVGGAPAHFDALVGRFRRLLMDGRSRLHLVGETGGAIARLDRRSGVTAMTGRFEPGGEDLFMSPDGVVGFVWYAADANRRGLGFYDPDSDMLQRSLGGTEAFGWLLHPIGIDASHRFYAWRDGSVARIAPDGRIVPIAAFDAIVVRAGDGSILTSLALPSVDSHPVVRVTWHGPEDRGRVLHLQLPAETRGTGGWRLVHADALGGLHLFGGESPGDAGRLLVYAAGGALEEVRPGGADLIAIETRTQAPSDWQVDGEGRLYVPVLAPDGVRIIRLASDAD